MSQIRLAGWFWNMNEKFLRYNLNLTEDSSWLVVSPNSVMENLELYIQEVGEFYIQGPFMVEREGLASYQIAFLYGGEQFLTFRRKEYLMNAGSAYFINCREPYRVDGSGYGHSAFIHFDCAKAAHYFDQFYTANNNSPVLHISAPCFIEQSIMQLLALYKDGTTAEASYQGIEIIISLMTQMLMTVFPKHDNEHFSECVTKTLNYLCANYSKKILLNDLAQETHMSKFHLSRLFRQATGASPIEYLMRVRINKAKELLRQTTYTVSQVSEKIGMENTSYFIKFFRRHEKMSPGEYRKKWS